MIVLIIDTVQCHDIVYIDISFLNSCSADGANTST